MIVLTGVTQRENVKTVPADFLAESVEAFL